MPTLNDARFVALRGQGFTGATNDMLLEWLQGQLPLANLLTNPELAGGAASGPVDGNNPTTGWTRPFNTADSAPVDIGGGFFEWEMNLAQDNGRCAISRDLADDLGGEVAGAEILFTVECSNPTSRNYSAALIASTFAGATVTGTVARVRPFSTETLALEFTIDDPATLRAEIRMGVGTTANNTVGLILRNPALYRSTDARTPRNSLPDAWSTFLALQLGSAATGQRNDDWYTYLGSLGHTGSLNDRELQFWLDGGVIGGGYTFNGADQYATHASWDTLGDSTVYPPQFAFITDNPDGNIVDSTPPITEFGRVGGSYHSGSLSNLQYKDTSPLNGKTALAGPATVPEVLLENAEITFDIAYTVGAQPILDGTPPILGTTGDGTLVIGANVDSVVVDGSPASAPLTGHQKLVLRVSTGSLTQIGELSAIANVELQNNAY